MSKFPSLSVSEIQPSDIVPSLIPFILAREARTAVHTEKKEAVPGGYAKVGDGRIKGSVGMGTESIQITRTFGVTVN